MEINKYIARDTRRIPFPEQRTILIEFSGEYIDIDRIIDDIIPDVKTIITQRFIPKGLKVTVTIQ